MDPIAPELPNLSPFNYASNNPITCIDFWGLQGIPAKEIYKNGNPVGYTTAQISTSVSESNAEKIRGLKKAKEYNQNRGFRMTSSVGQGTTYTAKHTENIGSIDDLLAAGGAKTKSIAKPGHVGSISGFIRDVGKVASLVVSEVAKAAAEQSETNKEQAAGTNGEGKGQGSGDTTVAVKTGEIQHFDCISTQIDHNKKINKDSLDKNYRKTEHNYYERKSD